MEFIIGDKKFVFKDKITGNDLMNMFAADMDIDDTKPTIQQGLEMSVKLICTLSINPKLEYEDLMSNWDIIELFKLVETAKDKLNIDKIADFLVG